MILLEKAAMKLWSMKKKNRITSKTCHTVHIRIKIFGTLAYIFVNPKKDNELVELVQDALKNGQIYESIAKEKIQKYMQHTLEDLRNICSSQHSKNWQSYSTVHILACHKFR